VLVVLVLASGAAWETAALRALDRARGTVVLRRCVDVADLIAAASSRQADTALVAIEAPGLDQTAVEQLERFQVHPVAVVPAVAAEAPRLRAARIGIRSVVPEDRIDAVDEALLAPGAGTGGRGSGTGPGEDASTPEAMAAAASATWSAPTPGRVHVVWGPPGAPGRTTIAVALAAEVAARGRRTTLIDADSYAGTVAQHLGILDEVSGLLAAARLAGAGMLGARFASVQREVGPHQTVVTGLPRADRWAEVRGAVLEQVLDLAAAEGEVVVDAGFCTESDTTGDLGRTGRHQLTLSALERADSLVVVGAADPVGLTRLARSLLEVRELDARAPVTVVVNRTRASLGWSENDVARMIEGLTEVAGLHFLPDDRLAVDRALVAGRSVQDGGESPLARAVSGLVDGLVPESARAARAVRAVRSRRGRRRLPTRAPLRRRTAGRAPRP